MREKLYSPEKILLFIIVGIFFTKVFPLPTPNDGRNDAIDLNSTKEYRDDGDNQTKDDPSPRRQAGDSNAAIRYTTVKRTTKGVVRSTPNAIEFDDPCEFQAAYCINVYKTGRICARSPYTQYYTFDSHCLLDYINCKNRFNMWEIAYMGDCINATYDVRVHDYMHYPAFNDYFMDDMYVIVE